MYLCKTRFAATEYIDEQPDENFKQNVLIKNSGVALYVSGVGSARRSCRS